MEKKNEEALGFTMLGGFLIFFFFKRGGAGPRGF
jgi:hypothetical protein